MEKYVAVRLYNLRVPVLLLLVQKKNSIDFIFIGIAIAYRKIKKTIREAVA